MREPTNQNRQRETSLVAEDVKSEEWPEEETFVRVNQPEEGGWYVLPEQWIPCRWRREGGGGVRGIPACLFLIEDGKNGNWDSLGENGIFYSLSRLF